MASTLVTLSRAAEMLGVGRNSVMVWKRQFSDFPQPTPRGLYVFEDIRACAERHNREAVTEGITPKKYDRKIDIEVEKLRRQVEMLDIKIQSERDAVVSKDKYSEDLCWMAGVFSQKLDQLSARVAIEMKEFPAAIDTIEKVIRELKEDLSDWVEACTIGMTDAPSENEQLPERETGVNNPPEAAGTDLAVG